MRTGPGGVLGKSERGPCDPPFSFPFYSTCKRLEATQGTARPVGLWLNLEVTNGSWRGAR